MWASLVAQRLKRLPAMWETWVQSLGREGPLEKEMATHSSILAWRPHGRKSLLVYSPRGHKESDTTERLNFHYSCIYIYTYVYTCTYTCVYIKNSLLYSSEVKI